MRYLVINLQAAMLFVACMLLGSCSDKDNNGNEQSAGSNKSIVILFESDSHCELSGYPKLAGLRDAINRSDTAWAGVVCCGDFMQGGAAGSISQGAYVIDVMKSVGYDAVTLGNHEFEYGGPNVMTQLQQLGAPIICANFFMHGASAPVYPAYTIHQYGGKRVAFIGVLTPETIVTQKFAFYDSEGKQLYDLPGEGLMDLVQQTINEVRSQGADYVVVLSHMGERSNMALTSHDLIKGTRGIDAVLDGHTHSSIAHEWVENLDGKPVLVAQTGNKFKHIGKLVIQSNGELSTSLLPTEDIMEVSASVTQAVEKVQAKVQELASVVVCHSDYALIAQDANKTTLSTLQETTIGDLTADAFLHFYDEANIAIHTGSSLSVGLPAGDIKKQDLMNMVPFEDQMYLIEVKGELLVNTLAGCTQNLPGFCGHFPQCSGIKYTVHQKSHTVTDVMVLDRESGNYQPLNMEKNYKVSLGVFYSSLGFLGMLKDCKVIAFESRTTRDAIEQYLTKDLKGQLGEAYRQPQGRITIVDD